jgi:hypothetical protein
MRALLRAGPVLLALGVALWGCNYSGDGTPLKTHKGPGENQQASGSGKGTPAKVLSSTSSSQQVVLGLSGLT